MDINTACTSFLYGLSTATAMIRTGVVRNALVIGVEGITPYMDWSNRNVAVLFGDGAAAVVVQASDKAEGVIAEKLGCYADARAILRVRGMGTIYGNAGVQLGDTTLGFRRPGNLQARRARHGERVAGRAGARRHLDRRDRSRRPAPGEPAHHRVGREALRHPDGARVRHRAALRQHVVRNRAGRARRGAGRRPREAGLACCSRRRSAAD